MSHGYKIFEVKDLQNDGLRIKVDCDCSKDNVSDIATKNVTGDVHDNHLETYTMDKVSIDVHTQNSYPGFSCTFPVRVQCTFGE